MPILNASTEILSDIVVYSKYARYLPNQKRREDWPEICYRNAQMHASKYPTLANEIYETYGKYIIPKKVFPSMRSLQFAGAAIEKSPARIYNCSYLPIESIAAFSEITFLLLSGCGTGVSVQPHHIDKLPDLVGPNSTRHRRFLIGDSIEGWADAIKVLCQSYFLGKNEVIFDYSDIRHKGAHLVTAGGKAPGPQPLKDAIHNISRVFDTAIEERGRNTKLKSIEAYDIICHIADAVLAGGIRRAAIITLFSPEDSDMYSSKTGSWWEKNPQRGRSNNSVMFLRHELDESVFIDAWKYTEASGAGEPGIVLSNDKDWGVNPCVTGDTLVKVCDHSLTVNGQLCAEGVSYDIPMKKLVELYETSIPPLVYSYNVDTNKIELDYLESAALTRKNTEVIEISDEVSGISFKCTPDHKIYTKNRGWIEAKHLEECDELVTYE